MQPSIVQEPNVPKMLDFRSDTVTRPTSPMRQVMAQAEVGDDVFAEDPSVNALQERLAQLLGKEAALFVPSGTMSNQIALRVHCVPGDEFICEAACHIYNYEQGGYAQLSGLAARTVEGEAGVFQLDQLRGLVRPANDHLVRTRLVCIENTHNRGAGRIQPYAVVEEICSWAHGQDLLTHLDGARLFNAVVETGISARDWSRHFDTVSICFSKGLGAPAGSALAGSREAVARARRHRKLFGGGMRQAGVLAAAALYALENHVDRLAEDHRHARQLAEAVRQVEGLSLRYDAVDTNMVIFQVDERLGDAAGFCAKLKERGLLMLAIGSAAIRAVTHLDVDAEDVALSGEILREVAAECRDAAVAGGARRDMIYGG